MAKDDERLPGQGAPEAEQPDESKLKPADAQPGPSTEGAELNDPPLRTNRPDEPLVGVLKSGAGAHTPLDDPDFDEDGRYIGPTEGRPKAESRERATSTKASTREAR